MKYSTTVTLNNIGYIDLKLDIGRQDITQEEWKAAEPYISCKQNEELLKMINRGIKEFEKAKRPLKDIIYKIQSDLQSTFEDLPF